MSTLRKLPILPLLLVSSLLVLALLWLARLPIATHYNDLAMTRGYYADSQAQANIVTIANKPFTEFTGPLFRGNDQSPLWLRITLAPSSQRDWVLAFQPNSTHHIEVWVPNGHGGWQHSVVGSRYAYGERVVKNLAPSVIVQASPTQQQTIYARVITPSTPIAVRAFSLEDAFAFDRLIYLIAGFFTGVGLIMAIISSMVFATTRDHLWGWDALFNLSGLVMMNLQLGLFSSLVAPDSVGVFNQATLVANAGMMMLTAVFYYYLLQLFQLPRWMLLPYVLSVLVFPYQLWLILQGDGDQAMAINNRIILLLNLWGVLIAFRGYHPDPFIRAVFRTAYVGVLMYFLWWSLSVVFRVQTGNLSTLYPSLPVSLFTMLMLLLILSRNTQLRLQEMRRLSLQKHQAEQALYHARQHHEETSSFLGMLLHEVKNPLSTIRLTVANMANELASAGASVQARLQRVQDSVTAIDAVLERGLEIDQLVQGSLVIESSAVELAAWLAAQCTEHPAAARLQISGNAFLPARTDMHLLSLMVRNLLDNAAKYSPPQSTIGVSLHADAKGWRIAVSNEPGAAGLPDAAQVFQKYYRSPQAMRQGGMGLGLYWVRGVARLMAGDATYHHHKQRVVFTLCMPN